MIASAGGPEPVGSLDTRDSRHRHARRFLHGNPLHPTHPSRMLWEHDKKKPAGGQGPAGFEIRFRPDGQTGPACGPLNPEQGTRSVAIISSAPFQGNGRLVRACAPPSSGRGSS
jgi:hypothetical protein